MSATTQSPNLQRPRGEGRGGGLSIVYVLAARSFRPSLLAHRGECQLLMEAYLCGLNMLFLSDYVSESVLAMQTSPGTCTSRSCKKDTEELCRPMLL